MKKVLFTLFFCGIIASGFAQKTPANSFVVFLHTGYGYFPNKMPGLTNSSDRYANTLSSGIDYNAQLYYRHKLLMIGLLGSTYASTGHLKYSSDYILTTYIAPQAGMNIPVNEQFAIAFNGGMGGMWYRNNSIVYEKERKVTGNTMGVNLGLKGIYNFSEHFGLSFEVSYISAHLYLSQVKYHNEIFDVRYSGTNNLEQLAISLGVKFSL